MTLTRRDLLKTAAMATLPSLAPMTFSEPIAPTDAAWPENGTLIPDTDWHLWVDEHAEWLNDTLHLPDDVDIAKLPTNAPTGGWEALAASSAIPVTLPSSVEQHLWGKFGQRSYTPNEYRYAADDPVPQNGAYFGVSWWFRKIDIPADWKGKRIFLHVRGAHLRAEVYLNRKLVGYSIMEELPFEADLSAAADPGGENLLAIRITNPFGRFDWVDGENVQWGSVKLFRSHGFGALDRGMTISAHEEVRIKDCAILNTLRPREVFVPFISWDHFPPTSDTSNLADNSVELDFAVIDPASSKEIPSTTASEGTGQRITCPSAEIWSIDNPKLYHLRIQMSRSYLGTKVGNPDTRIIPFGFRTFAPEGLGSNALFRLNGKRIKIYTSISWGFWGINGMFPTPELAEKEVTQAKKLNLNCLNFHRNLAKEEVLRNHDRLGLLRYMEPGGGKFAIGKMPANTASNAASIVMAKPTDPADKFAVRYMTAKCVGMVRAFRSHPSVIEYCLQNEIGADLANPDTLAILKAMRDEDPSRCIVLNDGFVAPPRKAAQAWYEPWNDKLHRSDEQEYGGWWNQHQGAGDQWYDEFYKSPTQFTYGAPPIPGILTEYGEMEGCATPDNHSLMLHQQAAPSATGLGAQPANASYDHVDHFEILKAHDVFLDRWGFRKAFPATESLWLSLGKKCYDTWQNYLENARISSDLDFCAISGWESTAIENHSGIVDNLRNFKSDPTPIAATLQPVRPVAKQRAMCSSFDQDAIFDIYLLNDTGKSVTGELVFSVIDPKGHRREIARYPVPQQTPDQFSYLVKEEVRFRPKPNATMPYGFEGMYRFKLELTSNPLATQTKEIWITFTAKKELAGIRVGASGISVDKLKKQLLDSPAEVEEFVLGKQYDVLVTAGITRNALTTQNAGDTTGLENQPGNEVGAVQTTTQLGYIDPVILDAVRTGTPLLVMPQADSLSDGVAKQLADAGAFNYSGNVGDFRAPWMGNWYFVREHPLYAGMPVNQAMGIHYGAKGRQSNGLLVDGPNVEIVVAYSRDHDRRIGAGTFITRLGKGRIVYHRVPDLHPVLQRRFLANALDFLARA